MTDMAFEVTQPGVAETKRRLTEKSSLFVEDFTDKRLQRQWSKRYCNER